MTAPSGGKMGVRSRKRNWLWLLAGIASLAALMLLIGQKRQPVVPRVSVAPVTRGTLIASISSNGKVEPVDPHIIQSRLSSFVLRVNVAEGQVVRRGDLLMTLDSRDLSDELGRRREELAGVEEELRIAREGGGRGDEIAQLDGEVARADLELERLKRERESLERLLARQAATRDELDRNRFEADRVASDRGVLVRRKEELARRASINVEGATQRTSRIQDSIRLLEGRIAEAAVVAPADGVVYTLAVRNGMFARVGDALAEIADLRRMRVRAFIDEPELGSLRPGEPVEITWDARPERTWNGTVERVPTTVVSRGTRNVGEVLCSIENEQQELLPNVNVGVKIRVQERSGVLKVPRAAVRFEGNQRSVFLFKDGKVSRREIRTGIANATEFEVLDGLAEGDRVALPGEVELKDAMIVQASEVP